MVNPGGPSKGCRTCIQRKIRCDRQRPTCGQCIKSARYCGGYRDDANLVFRDQTQMLHAKAGVPPSLDKDQQSFSREERSYCQMTRTANTQCSDPASYSSVLIPSPKLNAEQGMIHFFANNFTCSGANSGTNLFWVPNNFDDLLKNYSARHSVLCAGAMALARLRRSSYYYREAQKAYGLALLSLAQSWRQKVQTDQDAIMVAILFLGFFEVLASHPPSSRQSWMTHLGGLAQVLGEQGSQHRSTDFGARMILQSRSQVIMNALQTRAPVPAQYQKLTRGMHHSMARVAVHADTADALLIRLATIQAQFWASEAANAPLAEMMVLDNDIDQWIRFIVTSITITTWLTAGPSELWWALRYDLYPKPAVAHVCNKMRAARIIISDLMQQARVSLSIPDGDTDSTMTIPLLVTDICATIPIYYRPSYAITGSDATESLPQLGTTYWLFWPLEIVGSMTSASLELKQWTRQCFERIYETTGIVKAQLAAQRLQERMRRAAMT